MQNPYQTADYRITWIKEENPLIKRFKLKLAKGVRFCYQPGQIVFASIPGFGEAPFAPCGPAQVEHLELCIRKTGKFTYKIHSLKVGDRVGIRGPYGRSWPLREQPITNNQRPTKNLLIIVGGLGLIPVRTLILGKDKFLDKDTKIQIFYGAKHPLDFLFKEDYEIWKKRSIDLQLTIDKECPGWDGCVGVVTVLFDRVPLVENPLVFLVGPPVMYKFVLEKLKEKGVPDQDIYMSLERRMHCGIGVCQHCAIGSFYTCKDGPVFRYDEIKDVPGTI